MKYLNLHSKHHKDFQQIHAKNQDLHLEAYEEHRSIFRTCKE